MATLPAFFTNTVSSETKKSGSIIEKNNFVNVISGPELKYVQDRCVGSYLLERLEMHGHQIAQVNGIAIRERVKGSYIGTSL